MHVNSKKKNTTIKSTSMSNLPIITHQNQHPCQHPCQINVHAKQKQQCNNTNVHVKSFNEDNIKLSTSMSLQQHKRLFKQHCQVHFNSSILIVSFRHFRISVNFFGSNVKLINLKLGQKQLQYCNSG